MTHRGACGFGARTLVVLLGAGLLLGLAGCGGSGGGGSPPAESPAWFIPASLVLGQATFVDGQPNRGGAAAADTLNTPRGRAAVSTTAGEPTYIPDTGNHRVLGFLSPPTVDGVDADFVLGQINTTNTAAGGGASQFNEPTSPFVSGGKLFLCDSRNNRVLIWNTLPTGFAPANVVLGQPNFVANSPTTSATGMDEPRDVFVAGGRLFVVDAGNHRVLIWNTVPTVSGTPVDVVVGHLTTNDGTANHGGFLGPTGLGDPQSVWSDGTRLFVADTANSRVVIWNAIPTADGTPADLVLGQPHLYSRLSGAGADGMVAPAGLAFDGTRLFVQDTQNARILVWNALPTASATPADHVLGQTDFEHNSPYDDNQDDVPDTAASARTLGFSIGLTIAGGRLYVTDWSGSRILGFDLP